MPVSDQALRAGAHPEYLEAEFPGPLLSSEGGGAASAETGGQEGVVVACAPLRVKVGKKGNPRLEDWAFAGFLVCARPGRRSHDPNRQYPRPYAASIPRG